MAMWLPSQDNYAAAGDRKMMALAFAQIAGGSSAPAPSAEEPLPVEAQPTTEPEKTQEPEPQTEPTPEPEPKSEPEPQAKPTPKPESKPEPSPEKKVEPKPQPKKVVQKAQKKEAPKAKPKQEVRKDIEQSQQNPAPAPAASASSAPAATAGGAVAKADNGVSTLVYGEVQDPFLSEVKRLIEKSLTYPRKARMMRLTGRTTVQFTVAKDGTLSETTVYEGSGHEILDKAAMKAVKTASKQWSAPNRIVRLRLPVVFALR